jgi:hypothetical protein
MNHFNWKGMSAKYEAKHRWLYKKYGKADHCENDPSHISKRFEWANISGEYKREVSDYKQLCVPCHRTLDNGNFCKYGHEYTPGNTKIKLIKSTGRTFRLCITCTKLYARERYRKLNPGSKRYAIQD